MVVRGAYHSWDMIAGDDEIRVFILWADEDHTARTDLTGCTAVAQGKDEDGNIIWTDAAVDVGDALGTLTVEVLLAVTAAQVGKKGSFEVQVTWVDTKKWSPVYGDFKITTKSLYP